MKLKFKRKWKHYGLRTCHKDGSSYNGFVWPESGLVSCPDWNPSPACGNGLHALLDGQGNASLIPFEGERRWQVVGFDSYTCLKDKVKFQSCEVVSGDQAEVTNLLQSLTGKWCHFGTASAGDSGTASAGYRGTASAGYKGTASAGHKGTASAGDRGTASAGYRGTASAGYKGTASAGYKGTASAGDSGTILIKWFDGRRYRTSVACVGEDGIKPNTLYKLDGKGRFVKV